MMNTETAARIANEILLEEAGQSGRIAEDGSVVTFGRLKGTVSLATTTVRVGEVITSFKITPMSGKPYLAGRLSALLDETTVRKCAEKAHQSTITINNWATVNSEIHQS
jgi:hypothetical protein